MIRALVGVALLGLGAVQEERPTEVTDLLKLIDPDLDEVGGIWTMAADVLQSPPVPVARLRIPYLPPEEYDLRVVAELKGEPESLNLGLPAGGKRIQAILGGWNGTASGLHFIDGKAANENETTVRGPVFAKDQARTIVCSVRKDRVTVSVDGQTLIDWKPDYGRAADDPGWSVGDEGVLFIGSYATTFQIRKLELIPVRGSGRFHRPARQESRAVGGEAGTPFEDLAPRESILVGLRVTWDYFLSKPLRNGDIRIVKTIQPLFQGKKGAGAGDIHGEAVTRDCWTIVANPGYAVGGIIAKGAAGVDGLKVVFFRIRDGGLDRKDRYESDWYGGRGGGPETMLGGDGRPVLGIRGTADEDLIGLGLVQGDVPSGTLEAIRALPVSSLASSQYTPGQGTRRHPFLSESSATLVGILTLLALVAFVVVLFRLGDNPIRRVWVGTLGGAAVGLGLTGWWVLQAGDVRTVGDFFYHATTSFLSFGAAGVLIGAVLARAGVRPILLGSGQAIGMGVVLAILGYVVGIPFGGIKEFVSYYSFMFGGIGFCIGVPLSAGIFISLRHRASVNKGSGQIRGPHPPAVLRRLPGAGSVAERKTPPLER